MLSNSTSGLQTSIEKDDHLQLNNMLVGEVSILAFVMASIPLEDLNVYFSGRCMIEDTHFSYQTSQCHNRV